MNAATDEKRSKERTGSEHCNVKRHKYNAPWTFG
jgi:hypothetical protein